MNKQTNCFIAATAMIGIVVVFAAVWRWESQDLLRFTAYLAIAILTSGLKVVLPGINGTMSVSFLFILLGVLELSFSETVIIGCAATLVQCFYKMKRPTKSVRVLFNVCSAIAPAIGAAYWVYHHSGGIFRNSMPLMIMAAGCTYFLANTIPIATVIAMSEGRSFRKTWAECHFWSFPYYLAGAGLVALISYLNRFVGWQASLVFLPIVYWMYRSYRLYLGRLEDEKQRVEDEKAHVEEMASLHMRTIEALALAIEAKDHMTHDHLERVRVYAIELGKELGVSGDELEALKAAALLHDIGKLAIPEHIINKPGKLTAEEFEKVKTHTVVGAEILERVQFPYPVVPIVRSHHEKWDGSGYPNGLIGEDIPIGARILATVDCLDALATDRQYRRALPLDEAMDYIASLAGKDYDPRVVDVLKRRYIDLERLAHTQPGANLALSTDVRVERGTAPAAGFEKQSQSLATPTDGNFLASIAAARQEAQMLFELTHDLGRSLSVDDTLSVVSVRLKKLVPYDSIAIWLREGDVLVPKHVSGDNFRLFSSLKIPIGQGLSGWVVENNKSILNGNPCVEVGYLDDPSKFSVLRSALSVPLEGLSSVVGALTLYRGDADAFNKDHLRVLMAINSKIALSVENAVRFQQAESSATMDFLTGLPNAGSLFLHLDQELARCRRTQTQVCVMVCDLNGFKAINDHFGHLEGNKVLRLFAHSLKETCREYDYVARMGGDEFVIVAPGLTPDAAASKAERINSFATAAGKEVCGTDLLSVSIGSAFSSPEQMNPEQLLAEADRRMYSVKRQHHDGQHGMRKSSATARATSVH
jgi:diguanylate cyclase (GGDEF)-like protein/putative nucleotidyltransferase with HDIG domain